MRKSRTALPIVLLCWCTAVWVLYLWGWGRAIWVQQGSSVVVWTTRWLPRAAP